MCPRLLARAPMYFLLSRNRDSMASSYSLLSLVPNRGKCNGIKLNVSWTNLILCFREDCKQQKTITDLYHSTI